MNAAVEVLKPNVAAIEGFIDAIADGKVFGWAWDRQRPQERLEIEIKRDETVLARGRADRPRPDLAGGSMGDGTYAFEITLDGAADAHDIAVFAKAGPEGEAVKLAVHSEPGPEDLSTGLRRVEANLLALAHSHRQAATALMGVLRDIRNDEGQTNKIAAVEEAMAQISAGQQSLQTRFDAIEIFLLRFDTLLRQFDDRLTQAPDDKNGPHRMIIALLSATTLVAIAAAILL
jgi:hypothetical protein